MVAARTYGEPEHHLRPLVLGQLGEVLAQGLGLRDAVVGQRRIGVPVVEVEAGQALLARRGRRDVADALAVPDEDELGRSRRRHVALFAGHRAS